MADAALLVAGVMVIGLAAGDALDTLVSNRVRWPGGRRIRLLWLTDFWLTVLWRAFASIGRRITTERRREALLTTYAPIGLVTLVLLWMSLLVVGFSLFWVVIGADVDGIGDYGDALYFSGVVQLTVGFGEIVPLGVGPRMLALSQALIGVVFGAMVIGFLPSLYGAYSERERQLLLLDNLSDDRLTPIALITAMARNGDRTELDEFFTDWERWTALVMESHLTYPMLMWFRSQQRGQSWITALGVVLDAATIVIGLTGEQRGPAVRMYRRGTRAIDLLSRRVSLEPGPNRFTGDLASYGRLRDRLAEETGLAMLPAEVGYAQSGELRPPYAGRLEALIDATLAPRGFWPSGGPVPDELLQADIPIRHVEEEV